MTQKNVMETPLGFTQGRGYSTESKVIERADLDEWRTLEKQWLATLSQSRTSGAAVNKFLQVYLGQQSIEKTPEAFLLAGPEVPPLWETLSLSSLENNFAISQHDYIVDFLDWVIAKKREEGGEANQEFVLKLRNPFFRRQKKMRSNLRDKDLRDLPEIDPALKDWVIMAEQWLANQSLTGHAKIAVKRFLIGYLGQLSIEKTPEAFLLAGPEVPPLWETLSLSGFKNNFAISQHDYIVDFLDWVIAKKREEGGGANQEFVLKLRNPFFRSQKKRVGDVTDPELRYLLEIDPAFETWRALGAKWLSTQRSKLATQSTLNRFFIDYLHNQRLSLLPEKLLNKSFSAPTLLQALSLSENKQGHGSFRNDTISDFVDWVLITNYSELDDQGFRVVPSNLCNPFPRIKEKSYGKADDLEFRWVLVHDVRMEEWRGLAAEWLRVQLRNRDGARMALEKFLLAYIVGMDQERVPWTYLNRNYKKPSFIDVVKAAKRGRGPSPKLSTHDDVRVNNCIHRFIEWVLTEKLSENDDYGRPIVLSLYHNPVPFLSDSGDVRSETNKNPLPYRFLKELRGMIVQGKQFKDWTWAQNVMKNNRGGDWFVVNPALIDPEDPDCVHRERPASKAEIRTKGLPALVTELWSPVRAVGLYIKLELPLRTFQVRMLDSGESDTWRYDSGNFRVNSSPLVLGSEKRPSQRGVFYRSANGGGAGMYINTNKTADINKDENEKGYVIPWTYQPVLYWLEKLRNWQERYNVLEQPTPWRTLKRKHFGRTLPHPTVLDERGDACFLFRDAASFGEDRHKPLATAFLERLWHELLTELESRCARNGESLDDGSPIRFVYPQGQATYYPLHSLRVSLITAFALEGGVPFPILSKLIAGHARIIMTLYYVKAGKSFVTEVMEEAERKMMQSEDGSYKRFLMEKTYKEIEQRFAFLQPDALKACQQQTSAAGFVIDDKGICPVAGGLCDIGGEQHPDATEGTFLHSPVPGYPQERNCVQCRFFITGPGFLPGLLARFNDSSYQATECAERYVLLY